MKQEIQSVLKKVKSWERTLFLSRCSYSEDSWGEVLKALNENSQIENIYLPRRVSHKDEREQETATGIIKLSNTDELSISSLIIEWLPEIEALAKEHFEISNIRLVFEKASYESISEVIEAVRKTSLSIIGLDLQFSELKDEDLSSLLNWIRENDLPIKSLVLANNKLDDAAVKRILETISSVNFIRYLDLSGNKITDKSIPEILKLVEESTPLMRLGLRGNEINEAKLVSQLTPILYNSTLQKIIVSDKALNERLDKNINQLRFYRDIISGARSLKKDTRALPISYLERFHISIVIEVLQKAPQLTSVILQSLLPNSISVAIKFIETIAADPSVDIHSFNFSNNELDDAAVKRILETISGATLNVTQLYLCNNDITDHEPIVAFIENNGSLKMIDVRGTKLNLRAFFHRANECFFSTKINVDEPKPSSISWQRRFKILTERNSVLLGLKETNETTLDLRFFTSKHIEPLMTYLEKKPNIQGLNLSRNGLDDDFVASFFEALKAHPSVKLNSLNLSNNHISNEGSKISAEFLMTDANLNIHSFNFSNNKLNDAAVKEILEAMSAANLNITQLTLSNNPITDHESIVAFIENNASLKMIDVRGTKLNLRAFFHRANECFFSTKINVDEPKPLPQTQRASSATWQSNFKILTQRNRLLLGLEETNETTLDLSRCSFTSKHINQLMSYLEKNPKIQGLNLSGNYLDDDFVVLFFDELMARSSLKLSRLNLSENKIGNLGAEKMKEFLIQDKVLAILDLSYNEVKADGMRELAESLKNNRTLLSLDLSENYFNDACLHAFSLSFVSNDVLAYFRAEEGRRNSGKVNLTEESISQVFSDLHKNVRRKRKNGSLVHVAVGRSGWSPQKKLTAAKRNEAGFYSKQTISCVNKFIAENKKIQSNFLAAVQAGDLISLPNLFKQGVSVFSVEVLSVLRYPLHLAVEKNKPEVISLLIQKGAVDRKNADGKTALDIANEMDNQALIKALTYTSAELAHLPPTEKKLAGKKRSRDPASTASEASEATPIHVEPPKVKRARREADESNLSVTDSNEALFVFLEIIFNEQQSESDSVVAEFRKLLAKVDSLTRTIEEKTEHLLCNAVHYGCYRIMKLILAKPEIGKEDVESALEIAKHNANTDMLDRLKVALRFYKLDNPGAVWTHNLNLTLGSRKHPLLEIEGERLQSFLAFRNPYTKQRLQISLDAQAEALPSDVPGNPVTACLSFVISQGRYLKGKTRSREVVNVPLLFENEESFHMGVGEEVDDRIVERVQRGGGTSIPDRNTPDFNQKLHHGEQSLIEYLSQKEKITQVVKELLEHPQARAAKVYAVVLDISTPRYPCEYCQSSIKAIQTWEPLFLDQLKVQLIQAGFKLPQLSPLRMLTRLGAYQRFENKAGDSVLHDVINLDIRACRNQVVLMKDLTEDERADQRRFTQFESRLK